MPRSAQIRSLRDSELPTRTGIAFHLQLVVNDSKVTALLLFPESYPLKPGKNQLQPIFKSITRNYLRWQRVCWMKIPTALRISSATFASGETNFGVNQGNSPMRS